MSNTSPEIGRGQELQALVEDVYAKYRPLCTGEVASYIPELTKANPDDFGVCLVTADGRIFETGDCDRYVHHSINLETVHVRDGARRARARQGFATCRG